MTAASSPPVDAPSRPPDHYRAGGRLAWFALAVVLVAEVMDLLDTTIVNVAAPVIRAELGGTYSTIQWIAAGYTLAFAVGLITAARLGDLYGRKRLFVIGVAGFTVASAACALAASPGMLISFRIVQGIFAAILIPQGFGLIRAAFPPDQLGKAFALFGPVMGLSAVGGPILGGALVDADLWGTGWRMIFLINVPLGIAALVGAVVLLREDRDPSAAGLDPIGAGLATAGAFLVVYPLVQGHELGWPGWIFGCLALGVALFGALAWHLVRRARTGRTPLVMPSLFGKRSFSSALVVGVLFFAGMSGLMLVLTLYLQIGLGFSALHAGLTFVPWPLGIVVGAVLSMGVLVPRFGRNVIVGSALVMAAGIAGTWLTLRLAEPPVTSLELVPALFVAGLGMGGVVSPFFDIALGDVGDDEVGSASGLLNAIQQLGGALGVAVLTTLFVSLLGERAGRDVYTDAAETLLLIDAGLLVVLAGLSFLLPPKARPDESAVPGVVPAADGGAVGASASA